MKDRNYLINAYNATSTEDSRGNIETYEKWLEKQLLSRIEELEQLRICAVSHRRELYFAFMEEYNALMGEGEQEILKEEVIVLLAKYSG